jgi:hypothetical protein
MELPAVVVAGVHVVEEVFRGNRRPHGVDLDLDLPELGIDEYARRRLRQDAEGEHQQNRLHGRSLFLMTDN